jgi:predicted P-loop ATPase
MSTEDLTEQDIIYEGIWSPYIAFYVESIRFNCESAYKSIESVAEFIEMTNKTKGKYEITGIIQNQVINNVQNILVQAAAISRYFWPSTPGKNKIHEKRADHLRKIFEISDGSPLKNRTLRNQLEHFDEKLDIYLASKPIVGYVLPAYVGGLPETDGVPAHLFRAFYIDAGVFDVLGVRHEVQPIVDELCRIYTGIHEENYN